MPASSSLNKSKVKFPLKWQYTLIFAGLMTGIICISIILSSVFLPKYYEYAKIRSIRNIQIKIAESYSNLSFAKSPVDLFDDLDDLSMRDSLSIVIISENSEVIYSSKNIERNIDMVLVGYIFGLQDPFEADVIEQTDSYIIRRSRGIESNFIEMYGKLDNGMSYLIRTPVESIGRAAAYANRFYLAIGLCGIVISGIIIFFISKRISKPILQLNELSSRMVNLDFEARFNGSDNNEIGLLGNNINKLSDSLERSISDLKTANNELMRDIEKKEKAAEEHKEFISNVSHELKTPIALIQGYAEGLKEGISDDPESRDYYCDVIIDEAAKMNVMVKQLLNLDQLENGDEVIELERFDISVTIANYLQSAKMLAEKEDISVIFDEKPGCFVWGDPYKAESVITNYFSNAVHYCRETISGKYIKIYYEKHDKILRIVVFNTGDPIPEESISRLWEKFYKVDKARTREYGGSGIGLSVVKAIQTSIGKQYGVFNTDEGVAFWFELETCS